MPGGRPGYAHYCAIHRHLFQDVFASAGKLRTVRMAKRHSMFCSPEYINVEIRKLFHGLSAAKFLKGLSAAEFAQSARFLAQLNTIHPFREGNGRKQLTYLTLLATQAGVRWRSIGWTRGRAPRDGGEFDSDESLLAILIESLIQA